MPAPTICGERGHDGDAQSRARRRAVRDRDIARLSSRHGSARSVLVAAGLSNAAIAEQLVLTKRTVANHLASILARLQLSSHTEVAVSALEQGLHAGQDRLLASVEQLLNQQPTTAHQAMTRLSNVVTDALDADKVDVFLHDPELVDVRQELGVRSQLVVPLEAGGVRRGVVVAQSRRSNFFGGRDLQFLRTASHWVATVIQRLDPAQQDLALATERSERLAAEELISVAAHDVRNSLAPTQGRLDFLVRRIKRDQRSVTAEDLAPLQQAVGRLRHVVDDLLDASRIEHRLLRLDRAPVDLASLVRESAQAFEVPESISVDVEAPRQLWIVADTARLRQALDNLLANAVQHSPQPGSVHVGVSYDPGAQTDTVQITITDVAPARSGTCAEPVRPLRSVDQFDRLGPWTVSGARDRTGARRRGRGGFDLEPRNADQAGSAS